ncbi:geranylgeranylglyceryl/heptaprenylglyceryl phosphate synthase [Thermogladius sp. 4427co]|uniref:geranylgeranylglyceryl/heptaprenylglyceryl phosphate synthase n=1 Tax=Thermogladius sp. 4427co TaxID=3450718 RepID=UPI003F7AC1B8
MGKVANYLKEKLERGEKLHFTLIDPAKVDDLSVLEKLALRLHDAGTDAFLVGGSIGVSPESAGEVSTILKKATGLPVIIFPGNINCLTPKADAVLFMVLMNSLEPYYLIQAQVQAAPLVKKYGLEPLPTGYLVVYGDTAVAHVGRVQPIPPEKPEIALAYALAAEMMGYRFIYLEAGSGASKPVPETFPQLIKKHSGITIIVGGGIKSPETANRLAKAGADIIVTGTIVEEDIEKAVSIIRSVKSL